MVETLEPDTLVIVHTQGMRYYVAQMIRDLRGDKFRNSVEVMLIANRGDAQKLKGERRPIVFDHACFDSCASNVQIEEMGLARKIADTLDRFKRLADA